MVMPFFQRSYQELISLGLVPNPGETQAAFVSRGNRAIAAGPLPVTAPVYEPVTAPVTEPVAYEKGKYPGMTVGGPEGVLETIAGVGAGGAVPALGGMAAILGAIGIPTAGLAAIYGLSQVAGVQYPWETGPGEGFIAPWSRDIVQDEGGRWVTRETRPDLFANGGALPSSAMIPAMAGGVGAQIVKVWTANGWPFAMDSTGRIHTVTKSGIRKSWKPYRSVVLGKNPSTKQISRAVTKLIAFDKVHEKIKKMARRFKT